MDNIRCNIYRENLDTSPLVTKYLPIPLIPKVNEWIYVSTEMGDIRGFTVVELIKVFTEEDFYLKIYIR